MYLKLLPHLSAAHGLEGNCLYNSIPVYLNSVEGRMFLLQMKYYSALLKVVWQLSRTLAAEGKAEEFHTVTATQCRYLNSYYQKSLRIQALL